jgi:predicted amidohydrolase
MKLALIQLNAIWENKKANLQRALHFAKKAAQEKCDVIVLPEMFDTGFSMNAASIAEGQNGETEAALSNIAKENKINVIAGFAVKTHGELKGRNMAFVYDRGGDVIATYSKINLFQMSDEDKHYISGSDIVTFGIDGMTSSVFICYDLRFPEIFRKIAKDVEAIFVIANWPESRKEHWEALLKARAIENQCFVIGANRTGTDGNGIRYPGASCVFDPSGRLVCSGNDKDEFVACDINPSQVKEIRENFPFLPS